VKRRYKSLNRVARSELVPASVQPKLSAGCSRIRRVLWRACSHPAAEVYFSAYPDAVQLSMQMLAAALRGVWLVFCALILDVYFSNRHLTAILRRHAKCNKRQGQLPSAIAISARIHNERLLYAATHHNGRKLSLTAAEHSLLLSHSSCCQTFRVPLQTVKQDKAMRSTLHPLGGERLG